MNTPTPSLADWFGPVIHSYSRAQAIEDGVLVDITQADAFKESGFKYHTVLTRAAYAATVEAGGRYVPQADGEVLTLKHGQSITGRLWDVLWMLRCAIRAAGSTDRVHFQVLVDKHGNGRHTTVRLWSLIGPGDTAAPVMTIMLEGED